MSIELCNAIHTFQPLMDMVLGKLRWECALVYINDVNIHSKDFDSHFVDLQHIFSQIRIAGLKFKAKKCSFGLPELIYLGHVVSATWLKPNPSNIQAVRDFSQPTNLECTQSFIGLINYYKRFVQNFSILVASLYPLLKKRMMFIWTNTEQLAFNQLKVALC